VRAFAGVLPFVMARRGAVRPVEEARRASGHGGKGAAMVRRFSY